MLVGGVTVPVPGLTTTENIGVAPPEMLEVAVLPAAVPVATGPLESPSRELTLPPPVAAGVARDWVPAGAVQVDAAEDFSLQELTSQEPAWATATAGVVKEVPVVPGLLAEAVTDEVPPTER